MPHMFSRRHYEFLASLCQDLRNHGTVGVTGERSDPNENFPDCVARCLAAKLGSVPGDKFNREKFLKACGYHI